MKDPLMSSKIAPLRSSLFERLRADTEMMTLIERADDVLASLGYTDHGRRHATLVGMTASRLLASLGYDARTCDLAAVAGLTHDLGNCAGRQNHASAGALFVYHLLLARGVSVEDASTVMIAVANHDENEAGAAVDPVSAALIIADKADMHRSRVRTRRLEEFDDHDRANYAVTAAALDVAAARKAIDLRLSLETQYAEPADLVKLFGQRFVMSRDAAAVLGCAYNVHANGAVIF